MTSSFLLTYLYLSLILLLTVFRAVAWGPVIDPTKGFIPLPLNESNLVIQWPYDLLQDQRYSFSHGVHKLWVFNTDKPHTPVSKTNPRTEIRIEVSIHIRAFYILTCACKIHVNFASATKDFLG